MRYGHSGLRFPIGLAGQRIRAPQNERGKTNTCPDHACEHALRSAKHYFQSITDSLTLALHVSDPTSPALSRRSPMSQVSAATYGRRTAAPAVSRASV